MNYIFDPEAPNPVQSRIDAARFSGLQLRGGLRFAGVDGNPREPWAFDKNNVQGRLGASFQLDDKTVLRSGYGRYFMNPVVVGFTQGFSISTPFVASLDANRTPLYNLDNPFASGVRQPPGSSLGLMTLLGQSINYSRSDFKIPHVDQFSIGFERQLPWSVVLEMSYVGSRTRDLATRAGINEPPRSLTEKCDITVGGNPAFCNELLPNPFFNVPGFEGTARFTSPTLSRFELSRPFPQFGSITENERNDGKLWYDSLQVVLNKRMSNGLTLNGTYTWIARFDAQGIGGTSQTDLHPPAYVDDTTRLVARGPYLTHRPHRITASGVWDLPGGLEIIKDPFVDVKVKGNQFVRGVQPCVAQRQADGSYQLLPYSVAAGCTEPYFLVREPFQPRTTQYQNDGLRRTPFVQFDVNLAKTTQITSRVRLQLRVEAFNVLNSAMYDERQYVTDQNSNEFGTINKNTVNQSNFPRFIQLGFKLLF